MSRKGIRFKTAVIILFSLLFSSLAVLLTVRVISIKNIKDIQIAFTDDQSLQVEQKINHTFIEANTVSSLLLQNGGFLEVLGNEDLAFIEKEKIFTNRLKNIDIHSNFGALRIFSFKENDYFRFGEESINLRDPSPVFKNEIQNSDKKSFYAGDIEFSNQGEVFIIIGKKISARYSQELLGIIYFYVNTKSLAISTNQEEIMIANGKEKLIYHSNFSRIGDFINQEYLIRDKEYQHLKDSKRDIIIFNRQIFSESYLYQDYNWVLVSIFSYQNVFGSVRALNGFIVFTAIITIVLAIVLSLILSKRLTSSLKALIASLRNFMRKKEIPPKKSVYSDDEIGELEKTYDQMIKRIMDLLAENIKEQEQKRILELEALQMQINPHFLYNTLDAIAWTAKLKKDTSIESLVLSLAKFFRLSLHKGDKFITLEEEIELINHFLEIELIRFPDKFQVVFAIDDNIKKELVLKLILQPIVENAIKHGISQLERNGNIMIKAYEDKKNNGIIFEIIDDGIGFDINENKNEKSLSGFGIKNVDKRIKLEYGNNYGVVIHSKKNGGTKVIIKIGKKEKSVV